MFTGIVQELGKVESIKKSGEGVDFVFRAPGVRKNLSIGDSVACDGVCLTATVLTDSGFGCHAVEETLQKTTLGFLNQGSEVNHETALTPSSPMGGHFVLGHIDGLAEVKAIKQQPDGGKEIIFILPDEFMKYCAYKGSICLNGTSLTISKVWKNSIEVAFIPHTLAKTNLGKLQQGSKINFEVDMLAKLIARQLEAMAGRKDLDPKNLESWGYGV